MCLDASVHVLLLSLVALFSNVGAHQITAATAGETPTHASRTVRSEPDSVVLVSGQGAAQVLQTGESYRSRSSAVDASAVDVSVGPFGWLGAERPAKHSSGNPQHCTDATTPHEISLIQCPNPVMTSAGPRINPSVYNNVKASVIEKYDRLSSTCNVKDCERGDFAGAVLRMAGHDFMDWDNLDGKGGSDGCIDFNDPDNGGLKPTLCGEGEVNKGATLNAVYKEFCGEVSYADFIVIAAEAVMIRTRPDYSSQTQTSPSLSFAFEFGRTTATHCPRVQGKTDLPNPENGCLAVDEVFNNRMGLKSWRASAALMGVHTLGRMRKENSGYEGWWNVASGGSLFNNDYYQSMTTGWKAKRGIGGNPSKNGWMRADSGPSEELYLDTDLCLYQGGDGIFAKTATGACHWSIIKSGDSNHNFCLLSDGEIDASKFPSLGCCQQQPDRSEPPNHDSEERFNVDFFDAWAGPATQDIIEFALDEAAWLTEFKKAWKHVTENNLNFVMEESTEKPPETTSPTLSVKGDQDLNEEIEVRSQWTWDRCVLAILLGTGATTGLTLLATIVGIVVCMMMKQTSSRPKPANDL